MKLFLSCLLLVVGLQANANKLGDIVGGIIDGAIHQDHRGPGHGGPGYGPGPGRPGPGRPPGYGPGYPPPGYGPGPGRPPGYGPGPGRPPGYGVTCSAVDNGWEEHRGGHWDCRECLAYHDGCTETCRSTRDNNIVSRRSCRR